jgi:hypothetical protein
MFFAAFVFCELARVFVSVHQSCDALAEDSGLAGSGHCGHQGVTVTARDHRELPGCEGSLGHRSICRG